MALSNLDIFSDDQAITADAASDSYVDLGKFAGRGEPIDLLIQVTTAFNNLTTLHVSLQECDTYNGTYADVISTPEIALASLIAGYRFPLNKIVGVKKRYIKLHYDVTGTAPTTGKIFAAVRSGEEEPYADGMFGSPRNLTGAAATA